MKTVKKILIAPDKFKYTLSSNEVTEALCKGLSAIPFIKIIGLPMADGGEGTSDILSEYFKSKPIFAEVNNPIFKKIKAKYYYSDETETAIIDLSSASGLFLLDTKDQNPMKTSTFGTGEMILDSIIKGAKNIILGLGGSATTDAGIGAAAALGYVFLDKNGKRLLPIGENLIHIKHIKNDELKIKINDYKIELLYDVKNQLSGPNGAAFVYSGQKGAIKKDIKRLDTGLKNISKVFLETFNKDVSNLIGGGAAGGFGAGTSAMFNASLLSGADTILNISGFDNYLKETDIIITGEGKFDKQSLQGKITCKIIDRAENNNIPVILICGINAMDEKYLKTKPLLTVQALYNENIDIYEAKKDSFNLIIEESKKAIIKAGVL